MYVLAIGFEAALLLMGYSYFVTELLGTDLHRLLTSRPLEKQFSKSSHNLAVPRRIEPRPMVFVHDAMDAAIAGYK